VSCALLLSAVASLLAGTWWLHQARTQAKDYARDATESVTASWSSDALQVRASTELMGRPEKLASYVAFLDSQLGHLRGIRDLQVTGSTVHLGSQGLLVVATVTVRADFEKGPAVLRWLLARQSGSWKVTALQAESDQIKLP
jgi:hypothetical protein